MQRFAAILREARNYSGTSLSRDAWRKLRRNRVAWHALQFLAVLTGLAVLTPILPLQSPQRQHLGAGDRNRQFLPPNLRATTLEVITSQGRQRLTQALKKYESNAIEPTAKLHPFRAVWHNPAWFDRALIRCRIALFGDWCIPSLCGTDQLGRDVLSRIMWGTRVSLSVGFIAAFVSLVVGVLYGATAGYLGGVIDTAMMRCVDVLNSIPFIFVVIFSVTILGQENVKVAFARYGIDRVMVFYLLIGAIYWFTMARVVRGQVLSLKHEPFIEAARVIGAGRFRIFTQHLLPNVFSVVIVYLTLTIPSIILFEAFLSFLGLGVEPPNVSWGILAQDGIQAINPIRVCWWLVAFPGFILALTLLALNVLGDGLRDALDPRLKHH